jgi:hypothetical protein
MRRLGLFGILLTTSFLSLTTVALAAQGPSPVFSWLLPKTVIDLSITYQYVSCSFEGNGVTYKVKIVPTIAARGVADYESGWRFQKTSDLTSDWQDRTVTLTTFAGSHILNTVGSHPVGQGAAVIGNILGGIVKIAGIALGTNLTALSLKMSFDDLLKSAGITDPNNPPPDKVCDDAPTAPGYLVRQLKAKILTTETQIAALDTKAATVKKAEPQPAAPAAADHQSGGDGNSPDLKTLTDLLQSLQTLLNQEQAKLAFTIKATIDPGVGYTNAKKTPFGLDAAPPMEFPPTHKDQDPPYGSVAVDLLVGTLEPTADDVPDITWLSDIHKMNVTAKLVVTVYMDFKHSLPDRQAKAGFFEPTKVSDETNGLTFRDPAYIPVLVRAGNTNDSTSQLLANVTLPFAQYGVRNVLLFEGGNFDDKALSLTFSDTGEQTNVSFAGKATAVTATSIFSSAASAASTIASGFRSQNANEATASQTAADRIYQDNRLQVCLSNPTNCPSK